MATTKTGPCSQRTPHADWDDTKDKFLLKALRRQINAGKQAESGFKKEAWIAILEEFNAKFEPVLLQQIKTHCGNLRIQFEAWQTLVETSGVGWNDEKQLPEMEDDEAWETYLAVL
ncbi:Myb/SANT-like domain-containing protein [Trichophaea hybrida]|nr:Myb/SANT-like domain-containing protein [Trichophaea hybrida]